MRIMNQPCRASLRTCPRLASLLLALAGALAACGDEPDPEVPPLWTFESYENGEIVIDGEDNIIGVRYDVPALFKLSPAGALSWQNEELGGGAIAVDAQGNIGFFSGADESVAKLDAGGNVLWRVDGAQLGFHDIDAVAFDPSGALVVVGLQGTDDENEVLLVKLDGGGNLLWSQTYFGGRDHAVTDMVVDGSGTAFISGAVDRADLPFVLAYDRNGNQAGGLPGGYGALAVDADSNVFVTDGPWLHKYAPGGRHLWEADAGDGPYPFSDLAVTPAGDVIALGRHVEDGELASRWVVTFDGADGTPRRRIEFSPEELPYADIAVDGNGDVVIAGAGDAFGLRKYDGALFDQPSE